MQTIVFTMAEAEKGARGQTAGVEGVRGWQFSHETLIDEIKGK